MNDYVMLLYLELSYRNTFLFDDNKSVDDIANFPWLFKAIEPSFLQRMQSLVEGVEVDLNQRLPPEDEPL